MRKLYLKQDIEKGQVFGLKDPAGSIRHVGRFYPDRPTAVESDKDAALLLERYPEHLGDWEKDREQVEEVVAERERKKEEERLALMNRRKQVGPAVQPIHADPKIARAIRRGHEPGKQDWNEGEEVSEEDLDNEIALGDGDGQDNPVTDPDTGFEMSSPDPDYEKEAKTPQVRPPRTFNIIGHRASDGEKSKKGRKK